MVFKGFLTRNSFSVVFMNLFQLWITVGNGCPRRRDISEEVAPDFGNVCFIFGQPWSAGPGAGTVRGCLCRISTCLHPEVLFSPLLRNATWTIFSLHLLWIGALHCTSLPELLQSILCYLQILCILMLFLLLKCTCFPNQSL